MADNSTAGGEDGPGGSNLALALIIGLPSGAVIVILVVVMAIMIWLTVKTSRTKHDVEAMYMRRRFQGLSLADQERMQNQGRWRRKKQRVRRSSSAASSSQLSESMQRARVRRENPFGLQEWQLRLSGIELGTGDTEVTLVSEEEREEELGGLYNRKPIGAINPLLMHGDTDVFNQAGFQDRAVAKRPSKPHHKETRMMTQRSSEVTGGQRSSGAAGGQRSRGGAGEVVKLPAADSSEEDDSSSSSEDSLDPYDA